MEESTEESMDIETFLDMVEAKDDAMAYFLREYREMHEDGIPPADITDELYYVLEDADETHIEKHLGLAIWFGVIWEKHDQS